MTEQPDVTLMEELQEEPPEEKKKKATKAEQEARIEAVRQLICSGATRQNILRYTADKFKVSERTTDDLLAKARKLIIETPLPDKIQQKKHLIDQLNRMRYKAELMQDFQRAMAAGDRIARLMGLDEAPAAQTLKLETTSTPRIIFAWGDEGDNSGHGT